MKRTTFFIDEALLERMQRFARKNGVSVAAVVREALAEYVAQPRTTPLPSIAGQFASGHTDTAERADELLWQDPHA